MSPVPVDAPARHIIALPLRGSADNDTASIGFYSASLSGDVEIPLCSRFDPGVLTSEMRATDRYSIFRDRFSESQKVVLYSLRPSHLVENVDLARRPQPLRGDDA